MNLFTVRVTALPDNGHLYLPHADILAESSCEAERLFKLRFVPKSMIVLSITTTKWYNKLDWVESQLDFYQCHYEYKIQKRENVFERITRIDYLYGDNVQDIENKIVKHVLPESAESVEFSTMLVADIR